MKTYYLLSLMLLAATAQENPFMPFSTEETISNANTKVEASASSAVAEAYTKNIDTVEEDEELESAHEESTIEMQSEDTDGLRAVEEDKELESAHEEPIIEMHADGKEDKELESTEENMTDHEEVDVINDEYSKENKKRAFELEYADESQLTALMLAAYEKVANENGRSDGLLFPKDIYALMYSTLNPDEDTVHPDEDARIRAAADELIQHQGLVHDDIPVHNGFITRGNPLSYMRRLAVDMHHHRRLTKDNN